LAIVLHPVFAERGLGSRLGKKKKWAQEQNERSISHGLYRMPECVICHSRTVLSFLGRKNEVFAPKYNDLEWQNVQGGKKIFAHAPNTPRTL